MNKQNLTMKKRIIPAIAFLFLFLSINAQRRQNQQIIKTISNKQIVQEVFPTAIKVNELDKYWYSITDKNNHTLGYAMTSREYCNHIKGYRNATPVIIITDKRFIIRRIALLSHYESLAYVNMLDNQGFFKLWNGVQVQKAGEIEVDAYTGATQTAIAISHNIHFLIENGAKDLPH